MKRIRTLTHEFVEFLPDELDEKIIYVSLEYRTVAHKCCCGCGIVVYTPISPTDWTICFDGESVSLDPSIGNWEYPCKSHYWIVNNSVRWASGWSREKIESGRDRDAYLKELYYNSTEEHEPKIDETQDEVKTETPTNKRNILFKFQAWIKKMWSKAQ
ncbi:DUF6527 family protein [Armatimonas sp.]|uniref:DUF6527 family protein n=1 Tax=Armatimonas sp. TaxID=1872638 RepID=UPI003751DBD8